MVLLTGTPADVAPVEAVPGARLRRARLVRGRRRRARRLRSTRAAYHAPWDYLGGYLACVEAGAVVRDANGARARDRRSRRAPPAHRGRQRPQLADALMPEDSRERARLSTRCSSPPTGRRRAGGEIVRALLRSPPEACARRRRATGSARPTSRARQAIREVLTRETGLPVFGEEAGGDEFDTGWLVDPLDGTVELPARLRRGRRVGRARSPTASRSSASCTRRCSIARPTRPARAAARSATSGRST